MEQNRQHELLQAWLQMSVCIRGNRLLSKLTFNEILICSLLYSRSPEQRALTATDICAQIRLLKSQVNHILTGMEDKQLIERVRSTTDRRRVYIRLREEHISKYLTEHREVMRILDAVEQRLGEEQTRELARLMNEATEAVNDYQRRKKQP